MRKIFLQFFLIFITTTLWGQGQVFTKKVRLQGYEGKITKVVMSGNGILDNALKEEVIARWDINPFEFCTQQECEAQKNDPNCFFLCYEMTEEADSSATLVSLRYYKAGPDNQQLLDACVDVVSIPVGYIHNDMVPSRNLMFLSAYLDTVQEVLASVSTSGPVAGLTPGTMPRGSLRNRMFYFSGLDLSESVTADVKQRYFGGNAFEILEEDWRKTYLQRTPKAVVSVTIAPPGDVDGAFCYTLLIGADDNHLYYFSRHKVKGKGECGFLPVDISAIARDN